MPNTISENFSISTSPFGLDACLSNLPENDGSDNSIRVVDLYSGKQPASELPVSTETNQLSFGGTSVFSLQQSATTAANLDTKQYGVVGSGAAAGIDKYKGDQGRDYAGPTKSLQDTKADMYSQVDVKLDGIFGKGQYEKPKNHYEYVLKVAEAIKLMSPEQQEQFKNDLEKIGQPFKTNFGQSRIRTVRSVSWEVALNTYMVGGFSSKQAIEQSDMITRFFAERNAALGLKKSK
jgi:hypothetical protein